MGRHCEKKVDYCANVTCKNGGLCRGLLRDYKCECVSASHSGRLCETVANSLIVRKAVGTSLGYTALLSVLSLTVFIVVMDVLKYVFHIDPVGDERKRLQVEKAQKKALKHVVAVRYLYVNGMAWIRRASTTV